MTWVVNIYEHDAIAYALQSYNPSTWFWIRFCQVGIQQKKTAQAFEKLYMYKKQDSLA